MPDPAENGMSLQSGVPPSKSTPPKEDPHVKSLSIPSFALDEEKGKGAMGKEDGSYPYTRPRTLPPSFEQRPSRASTAEAYLMRKWNLYFSGKPSNDVEAFLLRIKEARAIIPIADSDLFKCLPLFLLDMALYWVRLEN